MLALWRNVRRGTNPIIAVRASWLLKPDQLPCDWLPTMVRSKRKPGATGGEFLKWKTPLCALLNAGIKQKIHKRTGF